MRTRDLDKSRHSPFSRAERGCFVGSPVADFPIPRAQKPGIGMERGFLARFFGVVLLSYLALAPQLALAAPLLARIGPVTGVLTLQPDPPTTGVVHATLQLQGVGLQAATFVRFSSWMPTMRMVGPSGAATSLGAGRYAFDLPLQSPGALAVTLHLRGGVNGVATYRFAVVAGSSPRALPRASLASMPGMSASESGDPAAWRTAVFVLAIVMLIGIFALRRDRSPATLTLVISAVLVVVVLAILQARYASPAMNSMETVRGNAPVPVTLATVRRATGSTDIWAPGNVEPYLTQRIVTRVPGLLSDFSAYAGDTLRAGQSVAHLQEPELQSDLRAAQAETAAARSDLISVQSDVAAASAGISATHASLRYWNAEIAREKSLLDQGAVSPRAYQDERAQASQAQSAYDSARAKLVGVNAAVAAQRARITRAAAQAQARGIVAGYANVIVPNDAVVVKRLVDPGTYVQAGRAILQVALVGRVRVRAVVAQQNLSGIGIGTPMIIMLSDKQTLRARVTSVTPVVERGSHTAVVEAIVSNASGILAPGGFVQVILRAHGDAGRNALAVPSSAVVGGASTAVWSDLDGLAHRVVVTILSNDGITAQVRGDLHPGMRVVVTGAAELEEGEQISGARS